MTKIEDLPPEKRIKRIKTNKNILKFGCLPIGIIVIIIFIFVNLDTNGDKPPSYNIISEKEHVDLEHGFNKCNLNIRLTKKINKKQLKNIALKLRKTRGSYEHLYIYYYLPNTKVGNGAYATSHFDPDLELRIIGATKSQAKSQEKIASKIKSNIMGKWKEEQYTSSIYILHKNGGKIILTTIFPNSKTMDSKMTATKVSSGTRYDYLKGGYNGEYFILNKQNELEFYNKSNEMFTKALPIN